MYKLCFNRSTSYGIFFQKFTLELYNNPSTIFVLSPSNDKYLGLSTLVLFHSKFKSCEFGFLKLKKEKK